ncbi:hypothetical protein GCM10023324_49990 [Streptomyces youssoufiensis]
MQLGHPGVLASVAHLTPEEPYGALGLAFLTLHAEPFRRAASSRIGLTFGRSPTDRTESGERL